MFGRVQADLEVCPAIQVIGDAEGQGGELDTSIAPPDHREPKVARLRRSCLGPLCVSDPRMLLRHEVRMIRVQPMQDFRTQFLDELNQFRFPIAREIIGGRVFEIAINYRKQASDFVLARFVWPQPTVTLPVP